MLHVEDIHTYYGTSYVVQGVSLDVAAGETIAIVGRNGVGKTTTIRSIIGLVRPRRGTVCFDGRDVTHMKTENLARLGVALVPQGRHIFGSLTVRENLMVGARRDDDAWSIEEIFDLFPPLNGLYRRRGSALSGGEQSMLAIARALRSGPRCLLLDEPTEGLAPVFVDAVVGAMVTLKSRMKLAMIAVMPEVSLATAVADTVAVMDRGQFVYMGSAMEFTHRTDIHERYLGLSGVTRK